MKVRQPHIRAFLGEGEIAVDNFAGGGGASSGVAWAIGRSPDIAINHDPEAIAMHAANHPDTRHCVSNVWDIDPVVACAGRPVGLAWFSPTCTYFSKAKGTRLGDDAVKIRGLAWVSVRWAAAVRPRIICLENVEEFEGWGPLYRDHSHGCSKEYAAKLVKRGRGRKSQMVPRGCKKACRHNRPIESRRGETFRAFVRKLERLGYVVEWRLLRACDYGAPTKRRRLFMVARCDGHAIAWPEPTHGPGREYPYRTAAECIDWSIPCPSIFERDEPLVDNTLARIAHGIRKFVLENPKPFIVPTGHSGDARVNDLDEPLRTICGNRGSHSVVVPYMIHRSNGERRGRTPRTYDINEPLGTLVATQKHAACVALLVKHFSERATGGFCGGQKVDEPMPAITVRDHNSVAAVYLVKLRGTSEAHVASSASDLNEPVPTVSASGTHIAQVAAFLVRYNGQSVGQEPDAPIGTLDTTDRYGVVTVTINGEEWVLADIGMRMLTPRELYRAQGFGDDYIIDPVWNGKPLTKTAQVRMVGNSVPPQMSEVLARAQLEAGHPREFRAAA